MGKGKGAPEGFVAPVTPGRIIIEAEGVPFEIAKEALDLQLKNFPLPQNLLLEVIMLKLKIMKNEKFRNKELTTKEMD
jgi:ribosomal protein L16/L10AE